MWTRRSSCSTWYPCRRGRGGYKSYWRPPTTCESRAPASARSRLWFDDSDFRPGSGLHALTGVDPLLHVLERGQQVVQHGPRVLVHRHVIAVVQRLARDRGPPGDAGRQIVALLDVVLAGED